MSTNGLNENDIRHIREIARETMREELDRELTRTYKQLHKINDELNEGMRNINEIMRVVETNQHTLHGKSGTNGVVGDLQMIKKYIPWIIGILFAIQIIINFFD